MASDALIRVRGLTREYRMDAEVAQALRDEAIHSDTPRKQHN